MNGLGFLFYRTFGKMEKAKGRKHGAGGWETGLGERAADMRGAEGEARVRAGGRGRDGQES